MNPRDWLGKHERTAVYLVVALILLANIFAILSTYDLFSKQTRYTNVIVSYENTPAGLHVNEQFNIQVSSVDSFRVLYRSFNDPICQSGCPITIQQVKCKYSDAYVYDTSPNEGTGVYQTSIHDGNGAPLTITDYALQNRMKPNEVGCYGTGFAGKQETMTIDYIVQSSYVQAHNGLHSFFTSNHFRIDELQVNGIQHTSSAIFLPANDPIVLDTNTGAVKGISTFVWLLLLALLFTATPLIIYYTLGKDPDDMVPEYLHAVPNPAREAWQVDVMVNGNRSLSKNGLGALILSLYVKEAATIEVTGTFIKKIRTTVIGAPKKPLTDMEQTLLDMLCKEPDPKAKGKKVYLFNPTTNSSLLTSFLSGTPVVEARKEYYRNSANIFIFGIGFLALIIGRFFHLPDPFTTLLLCNGIAFIIAGFLVPASVFAKFKSDYHKEYLSWLSFKQMLTDFAQIQKYLKEDSSQWKDWLVYGTALGAAENVLKAMKELKLITQSQYDNFSAIYAASFRSSSHLLISGWRRWWRRRLRWWRRRRTVKMFLRHLVSTMRSQFSANPPNSAHERELLELQINVSIMREALEWFVHSFELYYETKHNFSTKNPLDNDEHKIKELSNAFTYVLSEFSTIFDDVQKQYPGAWVTTTGPSDNIEIILKTLNGILRKVQAQIMIKDGNGVFQPKPEIAKLFNSGNYNGLWVVMEPFYNDLDKFVKDYKSFLDIQAKEKVVLKTLVDKIKREAQTKLAILTEMKITPNPKDSTLVYWIHRGLSKKRLLPLQNLTIIDVGQKYRSNIAFPLHKDRALPVEHYNLVLPEKNIHIIPIESEEKFDEWLRAA